MSLNAKIQYEQVIMTISSHSEMAEDEVQTLVIDNGSGMKKIEQL